MAVQSIFLNPQAAEAEAELPRRCPGLELRDFLEKLVISLLAGHDSAYACFLVMSIPKLERSAAFGWRVSPPTDTSKRTLTISTALRLASSYDISQILPPVFSARRLAGSLTRPN
ncbi:hypothetical protein B0H13DRAFT_1900668 [Mycena leptocephala]|nr:hypothetical protein B0H13DRAFT_1900668 [Mycena leptocephala]